MLLVRLIYASKISEQFSIEDIDVILSTARKNNAKKGITGLLCFDKTYFLQCLEGSRTEVNSIYAKIANDSRHQELLLIDFKEVMERQFHLWHMGFIPRNNLTANIISKYSIGAQFNPYQMRAESCFRLLSDLSQSIPKC